MSFRSAAARAAASVCVALTLMLLGASPTPDSYAPTIRIAAAAPVQIGVATWYGPGFEGSRTACGSIYRSSELTAASNTLPCGSVVTVTNQQSGAAVSVTITDRGAFTYPIIVDLSASAFNVIAHPDQGVVPVVVTSGE